MIAPSEVVLADRAREPAPLGADIAPPDASPADRSAPAAPLLAVCGLCGGAGATTLSYLLARFAATKMGGPVLVCDTGGPTAGLADCAQRATSRTLPEAAALIARGAPVDGDLWTVEPAGVDGGELRVIASSPCLRAAGDPRSLAALFDRLRSAHAVVVVDCGTLQRPPDRLAGYAASHVAWVMPATLRGERCARRLFAVVPPLAARELIVARRSPQEISGSLRGLTALAEERAAALVLVPDLPEDRERALAAGQLTLQAILGVVMR